MFTKSSNLLKAIKMACTAFEYVFLVYFLPLKFKINNTKFGSTYNLMNIQCPPPCVKMHLTECSTTHTAIKYTIASHPSLEQMPKRSCHFLVHRGKKSWEKQVYCNFVHSFPFHSPSNHCNEIPQLYFWI